MRAFSTNNAQNGKPNSLQPIKGNTPFFVAQAKLSVGEADDAYEKEADSVADKVVQRMENGAFRASKTFFPLATIQKKTEEENTEIQQKPLSDSITPLVQLKSVEDEQIQEKCEECEKETAISKASEEDGISKIKKKCEACEQKEESIQKKSSKSSSASASNIESTLKSTKGSGTPLPKNSKAKLEKSFGADFGNVRIHNNSTSVQMSRALGAQAFTNGNDIYFNSGKFNPSTKSGKHLLAHELTHVIQQNKGITNSFIQKQVSQNSPACLQLTPEQLNEIRTEVNIGIARLEHFSQHPQNYFSEQLDHSAIRNVQSHVSATLGLTRLLLSDLTNNSVQICIGYCPRAAEACFFNDLNRIVLTNSIVEHIDRVSVGSILHEYKHYKQLESHTQQTAQATRALIHTPLDELNNEYEAMLAGILFSRVPVSTTSQSPIIETPGSAPGMLAERGANSSSGIRFITEEVLDYSRTHENSERVATNDLSELRSLRSGYSEQISINSPAIHYPVRWANNRLILFNPEGESVPLGEMSATEAAVDILVLDAFWASPESESFLQSPNNFGYLIVYSGETILNQIYLRKQRPPSRNHLVPQQPRPITPDIDFSQFE